MGEGTAKKSFRVLDRNSDDWYVFFFSHLFGKWSGYILGRQLMPS